MEDICGQRETARQHREAELRTAGQQANAQADEEGEAMSVWAQAMLLQECGGEGDGTAYNADELCVAVELSLEDEEQMLHDIKKLILEELRKRLRSSEPGAASQFDWQLGRQGRRDGESYIYSSWHARSGSHIVIYNPQPARPIIDQTEAVFRLNAPHDATAIEPT